MLLKKLEDAAGVYTSNLTVKRYFITLKAEVNNLDINKLVNVPNSVHNFKTKVDYLDIDS